MSRCDTCKSGCDSTCRQPELWEQGRKMIQVYLASRYGRLEEMRDYRARLLEREYEVTSRWLNGEHQIAHDGKPLGSNREALVESQEDRDTELKAHFAREDMVDLKKAAVLIAFTEESSVKSRGRGGRHIEFGMALAWGIPVILVGPRENVFYCLPSVRVVKDFDAALGVLEDMREAIMEKR